MSPFNFKQLECPLSEKRRHLLSEHPEEDDSQLWMEVKTSKVGSEQRKARRGIWSTDTFFSKSSSEKKICPQVTSLEYSLLSSVCCLFPAVEGNFVPNVTFHGEISTKAFEPQIQHGGQNKKKNKLFHLSMVW